MPSDPTPTTSAERGIDPDELERELESGAAILHGDESTCVAPSAERVAALEAALTAEVAYRTARSRDYARSVQDECWRALKDALATLDEHA